MSCFQKSTQIEKDYIQNLEEKNKLLEIELAELRSKNDPTKFAGGNSALTQVSSGYFTIGSTEDEVIETMGDPTTYLELGSFGKRYYYGASMIFFEKGKVEGYNNVEGNLKVKLRKAKHP
jgi:hypothetical protein